MARILACGAFLKNAACLLDTQVPGAPLWSAQHGDLSDPAACEALDHSVRTLLDQAGGRIDAFFFCPHAADSRCECRKPEPGMLRQISDRFGVPLHGIHMVGDALRDVQAASAVGAMPVLVLTGKGRQTQKAGGLPEGTQVFRDLAAFAQHVAP